MKKPVPCARDRLIISFYSALKIAVTTYCTWLKPLQRYSKKINFANFWRINYRFFASIPVFWVIIFITCSSCTLSYASFNLSRISITLFFETRPNRYLNT